MGVITVIELLQSLHAGIEGVVTAPVKYPGALNTANLPAVIVWPSRATTTMVTARAKQLRVERIYSCRCYVEPSGQSNYDIPSKLAIDLLPRFIEAYFRNQTLMDGYAEIVSVADTGIMSGGDLAMQAGLTYAGIAYRGFVTSLTVIELLRLG